VSAVWLVVLVVGAATVALKATGPVLLGNRELPEPVARVVALLGPVLLSALVVTQTVGGDNELVLDARLAGVGAGAVAIAARAPCPRWSSPPRSPPPSRGSFSEPRPVPGVHSMVFDRPQSRWFSAEVSLA